jgi:L-threonylcarbamoyladenylate synthase
VSATNTRILPFDESAIAEAARLILAGEPVAVPTETVYGLAADATNPEAVARIYAAKGRPSFNPLIVHVLDLAAAEQLGCFDAAARELAHQHWPGPLTLVVPKQHIVPIATLVTAGLETIAIRVPAHPALRALLAVTSRPLAAPSANASNAISPTRAAHVLHSLTGRIPMIIDGGPTSIGLESTIVSAEPHGLQLLRPGPIHLDLPLSGNGEVRAPGMLRRHYAPSKPVRLNSTAARSGEWLIGFGPVSGHASLSASGDLIEAAAKLFDCLHVADCSDANAIAVAPLPARGIGVAMNDRLTRAASMNDSACG